MSTATASMFPCPHCDRQFRWKAEIAGQKVKCKCGEKFHVPLAEPNQSAASKPVKAAAPVAVPAEEESALLYALAEVTAPKPAPPPAPAIRQPSTGLAPKPPTAKRPSMGATTPAGHPLSRGLPKTAPPAPIGGPGLKVTGIGLLLHFVGFLAVIGGGGAAAGIRFFGSEEMAGLSLIAIIVAAGGFGLSLLGPFLYLAAPSEAGRGLIIAALASYLTAAGIFGYLVLQLTQDAIDPDGFMPVLLALAAGICVLVGHACLLGFYSKLADYLGNNTLAENATTLVKLFGWSIGLSFLRWIPVLGCFISAAVTGLQVVLLIGYVIVTSQLAVACLKR